MKKLQMGLIKMLSLVALLYVVEAANAQQVKATHDYTTINQADWLFQKSDTLGYAFDNYQNTKALLLKRSIANYKSASIAYPKKLMFKDGIIEADIASPVGGNGFVGLAFHIMDAHHYEVVYFRPGSSGTINAIQYMPEKQFEFNWWDYEAEKYQAKATLPLTGWFHVKLVVKGSVVSIYLDNQPQPVFTYSALDASLIEGSVGFWLGNCGSGAYKNLVVKSF